MAEQILQVNFGLNVAAAEYRDIADSVAESFARVPGLRWKVWFLNEEQRAAGGIYLFESQPALNRFLTSELATIVATHPALRDVTLKQAEVMPNVTAITRGPIGGVMAV